MLLQPWWVRTGYFAVFLFAVLFLQQEFRGAHQWNDVPMLGFVLIAVGCVVVGGLAAAAGGPVRSRSLEALSGTSTPAERSHAIRAVRR